MRADTSEVFSESDPFSQTLLDAGADIGTKSREKGLTPLHFAAGVGNVEIVQVRHSIGSLLVSLDAFTDTARQRRIQDGEGLRRENSVRSHMFRSNCTVFLWYKADAHVFAEARHFLLLMSDTVRLAS